MVFGDFLGAVTKREAEIQDRKGRERLARELAAGRSRTNVDGIIAHVMYNLTRPVGRPPPAALIGSLINCVEQLSKDAFPNMKTGSEFRWDHLRSKQDVPGDQGEFARIALASFQRCRNIVDHEVNKLCCDDDDVWWLYSEVT